MQRKSRRISTTRGGWGDFSFPGGRQPIPFPLDLPAGSLEQGEGNGDGLVPTGEPGVPQPEAQGKGSKGMERSLVRAGSGDGQGAPRGHRMPPSRCSPPLAQPDLGLSACPECLGRGELLLGEDLEHPGHPVHRGSFGDDGAADEAFSSAQAAELVRDPCKLTPIRQRGTGREIQKYIHRFVKQRIQFQRTKVSGDLIWCHGASGLRTN